MKLAPVGQVLYPVTVPRSFRLVHTMRLPEFLKGNALVMIICECVWRSTVDIVVPFVSLYVLELGGNYQTIGYIMSGASLASMLLYPLGGYIADYQGRIK